MKEITVTEARPEGCSDFWNEGWGLSWRLCLRKGLRGFLANGRTSDPMSHILPEPSSASKAHGLHKCPGPPRLKTR